jgi:hypothetical protein
VRSRLTSRGWAALAALAGLAACVPLWSSHFLPFQDAPQHLAAIAVLADQGSAAARTRPWFEVALGRAQYTGFYVPAALLARAVGPDAAIRLLLSLVALLLPASSWMLLAAFGRDRRLAVLAPALFHTAPLYIGLYHFVAAVPVACAAIALFERELQSPRIWRALALALLAMALSSLHLSALCVVLGAAGLLSITAGARPARLARALAPLAPALALLGSWAARPPPARPAAIGGIAPPLGSSWQSPLDQVRDLLRFGNVLTGRVDELFAAALGAVWIALWVSARKLPRPERAFRLPLVALALLGIYLVAPVTIGYIAYIHLRAVPFLLILGLLSAPVGRDRRASRLLGAAVVLQLLYCGKLVSSYRAFDAEASPPALAQVLEQADGGRRLLSLMLDPKSKVVHFEPYLHFGLYYQIERGGRARFNFGELPWMPVRFRRDLPAQRLPLHWEFHPGFFDWAAARTDADYVLLRTRDTDPDGDRADDPEPGPEFAEGWQLQAAAGRWQLFRQQPVRAASGDHEGDAGLGAGLAQESVRSVDHDGTARRAPERKVR